MLSRILSKEQCASCKFCCSFRRQSLWETPLFDEDQMKAVLEKYPDVEFTEVSSFVGSGNSKGNENSNPGNAGNSKDTKKIYTVKLYDRYKTDDPNEEAACPFLDTTKGCILPKDLKPFDCSIWPLRAVRSDDKVKVVLTPTCSAINKIPLEDVKKFVREELKDTILKYAESHPGIIKDDSDFFVEL